MLERAAFSVERTGQAGLTAIDWSRGSLSGFLGKGGGCGLLWPEGDFGKAERSLGKKRGNVQTSGQYERRKRMYGKPLGLALETLARGPRGGEKDRPELLPDRRNSELNGEVLPDGLPGLHRFEKADASYVGLKNEQFWHRMAAWMLISGHTNQEIANAAGVDVQAVKTLRAQRWFHQLCAILANESGADVTGMIQSEMADSVNKLIELRDFAESERVQLAATQVLIEQGRGKPTQHVVSDVRHSTLDPNQERQELLDELHAIRKNRELAKN